MMRQVHSVPVRAVTAAFLTAALLLIAAGAAQAETADDAALRNAAWDGRLDEVERLLGNGADPNVPDHNGWTALHAAAERADALILEALLESGGNPDLQDADGRTPLILAALFPYDELRSQLAIRYLLRSGAEPDLADTWGRTPLFAVAINHQQPTSARDLLAAGADPNKQDPAGITPLHAAVHSESKLSADLVQALVDGGARGDIAEGAGGETPLQIFVRVGSNDGRIVDALADAGADVDAKNPDGESPLHTAIRNGGTSENNRVVEALLAADADPCIKDALGYIPYNAAREGGEVHTMLANAGGSDIGCQGSEDIVADYIVDPADWPGETTARSNIRSGPGTDHDVVRTLDVRTPVHVTGTVRNADWLRVEVAGGTAFVHASLIRETAATGDTQAAGADSTEEPEHENLKQVTGHVIGCVNASGVILGMRMIDSITAADRGVERSDIFDLRHHLNADRCVGYHVRSFTGQCDSQKETCGWPCDDLVCRDEGWTLEYEPLSRYDDGGPPGAVHFAMAEAARVDPDGVIDDSMSQLETVWAETEDMLTRLAHGEDPAPTAAMLEEDSADRAGLESTAQESAPLSPICPVTLGGDGCWMEISNNPGCYLWYTDINLDTVVVTWSGGCTDGKASGTGDMVSDHLPHGDFQSVISGHGPFVNGKLDGHWKLVWEQRDATASITYTYEGSFVEGDFHGRWVHHTDGMNGMECNVFEWTHGEPISGEPC